LPGTGDEMQPSAVPCLNRSLREGKHAITQDHGEAAQNSAVSLNISPFCQVTSSLNYQAKERR